MRSPRQLYRDVGAARFTVIQLMLIGMVVSPLMHPLLIALTVWTIAEGAFLSSTSELAVALTAGVSGVVFICGYGAGFACQITGLRARGLAGFGASVASTPACWLLISAAAWVAVFEFFRRRHHWNKTEHGLSRLRQDTETTVIENGAGDGDRTHDIKLGKLAFYH